ncbi:unnamed protein product [Trifolium pratense]|uniref:Uncharacterized protein n=1 Tax=Trifolium pratense TaxID=57577 RepID=A0ACB0KLE7_TRIPR|nr:unnamed protein product [Trifolium pratense]
MVETILAQNGLNTGCRRPNFVSAFNEYVLQTELPRGWKVPKYTKFAGDTNESTVEHIARYLAESGNLANNENLRMKYFPNSLTKNAFTWFTTLPPNSIHSWAQLERTFHEQFYMGQTKISLKELASVKRKNQESIDDYLNRFRLLKSRCFTQVPEHELVEMAVGGLDYSIRKKLDTQYLRDMSQLADRVRQIERLKAEKARNSKFQKKKEIDSDPLPPADATYVEVYDCNMVEVIDAAAPVKAVPEEEYEKRVREVYPNAEEELVDFLNRCKLKNAEVMLCPRCSAVCDKEATAGLQNIVPYAENKRNWPKARPNQKAWPYKGANWGKPITKGLSIQQRLGPQNTFKPSGRAPVNQWVSGQYVTFNRRMMENGSSSNVNVNIVAEPRGSKVVAGKEIVNAATEVNKYSYRNNYKGKNPMTRTQWRRFQRKQKLTAKEAEAGGKVVATQKAEKVEMAKRPVKERLSIVLEEPIAENAQGRAEGEDDMEDDDLLDEGSDFDVMVNVVSILPLEYDVPTEVNELEEDFEALNLADHKPMLIIWREDGLVENVEADQSAYVSETGTVTLQNFDKNLALIAPCGEQDAAFDPNEVVSKNVYHSCLDGSTMMSLMIESPEWDRITAYAAENRIKMALEAINVQEEMAVEASGDLGDELALEASEVNDGKKQRLDCIYDDEPLGFEKDPHSSIQRMQAQDPLQEVDIGDGSVKRPTYISANIDPALKERMVELLKKYRDCFAWDYNEMPGLSRNLVEHRLPLRPDKKPVKQLPRRFAPEIMTKIKAEIERLLKCKFIRTTRYVEWLANIVPVIKKNGSLRVCIDFRDLNNATPKDEYSMPVYIDDIVVKSSSQDEHIEHLKKSFERMKKCGLKMNPLKCAFCVHAGDFLGFVVHKKGIEINQNKTKAIMETKPPGTKKQLQSLLGKINFLRRFISNLSGKAQPFSPLLRLKKGDVFEWGTEQQKAFDDIKAYLSKPPTLMPPIRNKAMKLYIAASDSTIGSMLAQEDENGVEKAIYYLSRILNDAETRYSPIEKLCLCLYFSCTKLKQYIKPVHVYVYSHFDIIKHMLLKPILHSRIGKWALALTEYSLTYQPLRAVKDEIESLGNGHLIGKGHLGFPKYCQMELMRLRS